MITMAIGAIRSTGSTQCVAYSVNTRRVALRLSFVATSAINWLCRQIVVGMFLCEVAVATDTRIGFMHRPSKSGRVNKQGNFLTRRVGCSQGFVGMTIETGRVLDFGAHGPHCEAKAENSCHEPNHPRLAVHNRK